MLVQHNVLTKAVTMFGAARALDRAGRAYALLRPFDPPCDTSPSMPPLHRCLSLRAAVALRFWLFRRVFGKLARALAPAKQQNQSCAVRCAVIDSRKVLSRMTVLPCTGQHPFQIVDESHALFDEKPADVTEDVRLGQGATASGPGACYRVLKEEDAAEEEEAGKDELPSADAAPPVRAREPCAPPFK